MFKKILGGGISVALILGAWVLVKRPPADSGQLVDSKGLSDIAQIQAARQQDGATEIKASNANSAPLSPGLEEVKSSSSRSAELLGELNAFAQISQKPLLSEEERELKKRLLHDRQLLRKTGTLLLTVESMMETEFGEVQNAALDLLREAAQEGDRQTSVQIIQQIILDPQVENKNLPIDVRQTLAGIKGELMFHAVELAPQQLARITASLPGLVSQKIWENVQAKHRENQFESQKEVQAHQARWGQSN